MTGNYLAFGWEIEPVSCHLIAETGLNSVIFARVIIKYISLYPF